MDEHADDGLFEAIGALAEQDVGPARREGIRRQCHVVLDRRSRPGPGRRLARALEPALLASLAVLYMLGVVERTLLLLGG